MNKIFMIFFNISIKLCIFDDYKEDGYFVYQTNKKYGTSNFYPEDVKDCNIVTKTFYRKIKEVK